MSTKRPVWSWTDAVAAAPIQPLTKFVCLNIARYLSSAGKGWRISIKEMMADTGLSNRSMATHLQLAADAKLLIIKREAGPHGQRGVTTYVPCFPDGVELAREAELPPREPASPGLSEPSSLGQSEPASPRPSEPASPQVTSPSDSSQQDNPLTPSARGNEDDLSFDLFWSTYPRGCRAHTKQWAARKAFDAILAGKHRAGHKATAEEIVAGAKEFAASAPEPDYVPSPVAWLNGARWLDKPTRKEAPGSTAVRKVLDPNFGGVTVHNTDEPLAAYRERMIREGKVDPAALAAAIRKGKAA